MERVEIGELVLDIKPRRAFVNGAKIRLVGKQWEFAEALALSLGGMVTREYLLACLHPDPKNRPGLRSIDMHASKLRKTLAARLEGANYVHSTRDGGYRLQPPA